MKFFVLVVFALTFSFTIAPAKAADPFEITWTQISTEPAFGVDWSPDGHSLVSGLYDTSEILILDWQTGTVQQRTIFPNQSGRMFILFSVQWSPDSRFVATHDRSGSIYILDPGTGQLRLLRESSNEFGYFSLDWSPDSASVAALSSDGYLDIISVQTGEIVQTIDVAGGDTLRGETLLYFNFDWSPDGNIFAVPNYLKDTAPLTPVISFWNRNGILLESYTPESLSDSAPTSPCSTYTFNHLMYFGDLEWANDSRTLVVSGGGNGNRSGYGVCRLNIDGTIENHQISDVPQATLRWSPDQAWLAASQRGGSCSIQLSEVALNYQTNSIRVDTQPCFISSLAWSPDSQHLAVATNEGLWIGTLASP